MAFASRGSAWGQVLTQAPVYNPYQMPHSMAGKGTFPYPSLSTFATYSLFLKEAPKPSRSQNLSVQPLWGKNGGAGSKGGVGNDIS